MATTASILDPAAHIADDSVSQLTPDEQALKDRIDRYNQLPEVKGEELVDQYLDLQTTAAVIKSAAKIVQSDEHTAVIDQDTKQVMTAEVGVASQHLMSQASDFLTACKEYKDQPSINNDT